MHCPYCGSFNTPGQDVCGRCGNRLLPTSADYGGSRNPGGYGGPSGSGYAGNDEPVSGVWREEWPSLGGPSSPSQAPLPPWLSSTGNAPSSAPTSRMPSAPFTNGSPAPQGNSWASGQNYGPNNGQGNGQGNGWNAFPAPAAPQPGQYTSDYPSQYPPYYGIGSEPLDPRGMPQPQPQPQSQQQMPPVFMVNPPEVYPPDTAMVPYGLPPSGPLSMPGFPAPTPAPVPMGRPAPSLVPALSPGTALKNGRYRIIQRYAGGSSGGDTEPPLMIATDTEMPSERVLVQELPLGGMGPEDAEFIRHGIVERLDTFSQAPGIARLRDSFVEQRRHFLVFELPSGDRLLDRLRRAHGPLPETTVIGIILQVLEILAMLEHSPVPIIHGNISPANIVLRPGGQVALVGFSPMLLIYPTGQVSHGPAGSLSHYSAPEQARGMADIRSDLYATCAVMHHAVTGVEPVGRMFPLARRANPSVSLELEDILGQGLRPSPGQRYQTPEALHEVLAPLASGKRLTHVDEELDPNSPTGLRPLRDAQGRLVAPRQRMTQNPLFYIGIVLMIVALLGGGIFYNTLQSHAPKSTISSQSISSAFASVYQSKGIGLSGGEFVFDTTQPDYTLKQKGALALAAGDVKGAFSAYQQAIASQPNDVEALIYAADLQILLNNDPYITVIAGVAFGADAGNTAVAGNSDAARYQLQGIYLAQQRFNSSPERPKKLKLRVLILNSGQNPSDAQQATSLMLDQMRKGNVQNIVGIIGWPESNQSRLAMTALGASGLPLISPTASANNLEDTAGNFYSLVPPDAQQAAKLADAAVVNLQAHRILVTYDPNDQEESAIATNFSNRVILNHGTVATILGRVPYDGVATQDPNGFKQVASAALSQNADLIYLVGDQQDAIFLANAVMQQATSANQVPPHILVGPQSAMSPFFGIGSGPAAIAARANPNALGLLYVGTLASISQWQALNLDGADARVFSDSFGTLFSGFWGTSGKALPEALAILAYDSTNLLLAAVGADLKMAQSNVIIPTAQDVTVAIRQFTDRHPFMGLGGAVGFNNSLHQSNKALGIYTLLPIPNAPDNAPVVQLQLSYVVGGKAAFCGQSSCHLST